MKIKEGQDRREENRKEKERRERTEKQRGEREAEMHRKKERLLHTIFSPFPYNPIFFS